jgi:tetratricopeptide (TPR) repeat protein
MHNLFIVIFLSLCVFGSNSYSDTHSNSIHKNPAAGIDELIYSGLDKMYHLRFDDAVTDFRRAQSEYPDDIKGYFYESMIYFHTAIASREEKSVDQYLNRSDDIIDRCDELLDKNDDDIDALFYKGQTHSYRSLLLIALNKSLLSAASDGNSGYRILSDVIEKRPDYYDAYMGLGLYKIAIGFVPEKFQWLLSLIGFDGDLKEGKKLLIASKNNGKFTKVESQVYLAIFSVKETEEDKGDTRRMLKDLVDKYPASPLFRLFYANILQQTGNMDEAIVQAMKSLEDNTNSLQSEIKKGTNFVLGISYFRNNDFVNSIKHFEEHLKYVNYEDRYNISTFHAAIAYEMTDNRQKALEYYSKARTDFVDERDGEGDELFLKYSKKLINFPMNDFDKKLLTGMNLRYDQKPNEALDIFNAVLTSDRSNSLSDDDKIRLFTETGHAYVLDKKDDLAIDYFTRCTKLNAKEEKWLIPHAYFELGKIYTRKGNSKKAEEMFEQVYDYGDYEFRTFLEMRLNSYLEN